jgi:hypothetical protein
LESIWSKVVGINRDATRHFIRRLGGKQEEPIRCIGRDLKSESLEYKPRSPALYQPAHSDFLSAQYSTGFSLDYPMLYGESTVNFQ